MSSDNYILVTKTKGGWFSVSHRFASSYYADECDEPPMEGYGFESSIKGVKILGDGENAGVFFATMEEAEKAATRRPDWITPAPEPISVHDKLEDAIMAAHTCASGMDVLEYGVVVDKDLLRAAEENVVQD